MGRESSPLLQMRKLRFKEVKWTDSRSYRLKVWVGMGSFLRVLPSESLLQCCEVSRCTALLQHPPAFLSVPPGVQSTHPFHRGLPEQPLPATNTV